MPSLERLLKKLPAIEAGLLVLAALFALQFHLRLPSRLPSDDDHRAAAEVVSREAQPGDAVLLHPWWTERARLFIPERVPVVSYLDDQADPLERYARLWVLAQPKLPLTGSLPLSHRVPLGEARTFGTLSLSLYRNDFYRPQLFSGIDALDSARVYLEDPGGGRTECPFDGRAFRCPGRDLHVAAEWHEIYYQARRCLWMHPPGGPTRLVTEFASLPGGRMRLEGGIVWEQAWLHDRTTLHLAAENSATGQLLAQVEIPTGVEGVHGADAMLAGATPVRVWTQSDNERGRDACVELRVLGPSAAEGP